MSKRTPSDIIRSDERNTYVMSCHLNRDELYKAMRDDIAMMCKEYSTLKARRDELLAVLKEIAKADTIAHSTGKYSLVVEACAESAQAAIANAEKPPCA